MKNVIEECLNAYESSISDDNPTISEENYFRAGFKAAELLKVDSEEFIKGRYKYKVQEFCKNNHKGFWHKFKCSCPSVYTETINCDDYWWKKIYSYSCGHEKIITRYRLKELEK